MKTLFKSISNHIDANGKIISEQSKIFASIKAAEKLGENLLGCTLEIRKQRFIIRMLELYYGGSGDDAHDWYRNRFIYKTSKYREQTEVQALEGFKVYLSLMNVNDTYTRMDIVVGPKHVPNVVNLRK